MGMEFFGPNGPRKSIDSVNSLFIDFRDKIDV